MYLIIYKSVQTKDQISIFVSPTLGEVISLKYQILFPRYQPTCFVLIIRQQKDLLLIYDKKF